MLGSLFYGLFLPFRALALILGSTKLLFWSALPILLTLGLYVLAMSQIEGFAISPATTFLASYGVSPDSALMGAATALIWIAVIFAAAVSFSLVATIIGAPFNDFLAEAAEPRARPPLQPVGDIGLGRRVKLIFIDILKSCFSAIFSLIGLLMSWIPGLNLVGLLLFALVLCFQFISYPQTRRGEGIRDGLRFMGRHPLASLGFGLTLSALFAIPFLACFALPLAVVGGTQLFSRARAGESRALPRLR